MEGHAAVDEAPECLRRAVPAQLEPVAQVIVELAQGPLLLRGDERQAGRLPGQVFRPPPAEGEENARQPLRLRQMMDERVQAIRWGVAPEDGPIGPEGRRSLPGASPSWRSASRLSTILLRD